MTEVQHAAPEQESAPVLSVSMVRAGKGTATRMRKDSNGALECLVLATGANTSGTLECLVLATGALEC